MTPENEDRSTAVLLVDDEPVVCEVISRTLSDQGLRVTTVENGAQALERLKGVAYACVLVDKNLPDMSGIEVLRQARKIQPDCAYMIITGYSSVESVVEAMRLGAMDYLKKPFEHVELIVEKVQRAIRLQKTRSEHEALLEKMRSFKDELRKKDHAIESQYTEINLFSSVLEQRIAEATQDFRKYHEILEKNHQEAESWETMLHAHTTLLMDFVKNQRISDDDSPAKLRGTVSRVARQLRMYLETVQTAKAETERRAYPRVDTEQPGRYRIDGAWHECVVVNLSFCGALFQAATPPPLDTAIELHMEIMEIDQPVRVRATIVRHTADGKHAGVVFTSMSGDTARALREFLREKIPPVGPAE